MSTEHRTASRLRLARRLLIGCALLAALGTHPAVAAVPGEETLTYTWNLRGFLGHLAGVFLPNQGKGELRTHPSEGGGWISELEITSPKSERGDYFLYGGETRADGSTAMAWSAYRWRGRDKSEKQPVSEQGVVDVASGIHLIRTMRPTRRLDLRIWSDGRVYPVSVTRVGTERITVPAGTFVADHYEVRGVAVEGERLWKGGLDLWFARDDAATPVRIQVERGFANVQLDLVAPKPSPRPDAVSDGRPLAAPRVMAPAGFLLMLARCLRHRPPSGDRLGVRNGPRRIEMRQWSLVLGVTLVVLVVGCAKKNEEPMVQQSETANQAPTLPQAAATAAAVTADIAAAQMSGPGGVTAVISFTPGADGVHVVARVEGAKAGVHGFHLHAGGSCEAPDFKSAGDHFNPTGAPHGAPTAAQHHAGDFGNIDVAADGTGHLDLVTSDLSVGTGAANDVVGKAVILHGGQDDLTTQPSGNSGPRIACGVVQRAEGQAATGTSAAPAAPAASPAPSAVY